MKAAVVLMAYGSPERLADVPAYYADIRGGRPVAPEHLADLVERYRRLGLATALACHLLRWCLQNNVDPHWDAANLPSCRLAEKLGYTATGLYRAHYVQPPADPTADAV